MEWAQSELDKAKEEAQMDYLKEQVFSNQIGQA
jgi:hypothetical protein